MKRFLIFSALILALRSLVSAQAQPWSADTLGGKCEVRYFDQGRDYSGPVRSSVVRLQSEQPSDVAALYIHGFNDYFFQTEMAEKFVQHGYGFYAVDLRKHGRSLTAGQKRCQVRSFKEYFPDIDSALSVIAADGYKKIVLMGHSTGGLVAAFYLAHHPDVPIDALLLSSPFLDWNLGKKECLVGVVAGLGAVLPNVSFKSGSGRAYGESLNRRFHGEWTYDTLWKSLDPTKVDLGWVRAVNSAQNYLKHHTMRIDQPILLMYSARSIDAVDWSPEVNRADAVLDVADIRKYGMQLGPHVTAIKVEGGMHDLILSARDVREPLYDYIFAWLAERVPTPENHSTIDRPAVNIYCRTGF